MFGIILAEPKPGEPALSLDTRQAVIRGGIAELNMALRQLPHVLPEMSDVQIQFLKIALGDAVRAVYDGEQHLESVKRVTAAQQREVDARANVSL